MGILYRSTAPYFCHYFALFGREFLANITKSSFLDVRLNGQNKRISILDEVWSQIPHGNYYCYYFCVYAVDTDTLVLLQIIIIIIITKFV